MPAERDRDTDRPQVDRLGTCWCETVRCCALGLSDFSLSGFHVFLNRPMCGCHSSMLNVRTNGAEPTSGPCGTSMVDDDCSHRFLLCRLARGFRSYHSLH